MKKNLIIISLLVSYLAVIVHYLMPHHHHDKDDIELVSHEHHGEDHDSDSDNDHHSPMPAHQHVSVAEGFDIVRANPTSEINNNLLVSCFYATSNLFNSFYKTEPPGNRLYRTITFSLNSHPFIISPDATRGSPVMA